MKLPDRFHENNVAHVNKLGLEGIFELAASGYAHKYPNKPMRECFDAVDVLSVAKCKEWAVFYLDQLDCAANGFDFYDFGFYEE